MNLYSVMLVDDEEDVIQVIMKKIDWESMGFQVSGYAHNGVEALEMAEECVPDVVLTDIKMPYMDGLAMSRKLKEQYPNIKIIIFSGFDEFEYAKEAIDIEVEQYLLKPVNAEELGRVFSRIREMLDHERDEQRNIDKLNQYYLESLPLLQESFHEKPGFCSSNHMPSRKYATYGIAGTAAMPSTPNKAAVIAYPSPLTFRKEQSAKAKTAITITRFFPASTCNCL